MFRTGFVIGLTVACVCIPRVSSADDEPPEHENPAPPPAQQPPTPADSKTPYSHLARPPAGVVPVPTPSPVVLGGEPTQPGHAAIPLRWKRRRVRGFDFVVMGVGGALTLGAAIMQPQPKHFKGPVLFDQAARDVLRAPSLQDQYAFRDASDVGLSLLATWPFFVDAFVTAWWLRGSRDTAEQMALLGLETLAVSGAIQGVTNTLVSRERPYGASCGNDALPGDAIDCTGSTHYRSFFSGHSAFSFTGAALICFEHMDLELLGGPWDAVSCAGAYAVAATTATFRVIGDVHYMSDILTGALLGTAVGYGVPLLHFKAPNLTQVKTTGMTLRVVPSGMGAGVVGVF